MNGHGRFVACEINASSQDQQSEPPMWTLCSSTATLLLWDLPRSYTHYPELPAKRLEPCRGGADVGF